MSSHTLFLASFLATFVLVRLMILIAPTKTVTGYLRHETLLYIHHIYIGIVLLAVTIPLILSRGSLPLLVLGSAVGLSLCLDELSAWILYSNYPERKEFISIVIVFAVFATYFYFV